MQVDPLPKRGGHRALGRDSSREIFRGPVLPLLDCDAVMYFPPSPSEMRNMIKTITLQLILELEFGIPKEMFYENPKTDEVRSK